MDADLFARDTGDWLAAIAGGYVGRPIDALTVANPNASLKT
jgi:hypothetical protein